MNESKAKKALHLMAMMAMSYGSAIGQVSADGLKHIPPNKFYRSEHGDKAMAKAEAKRERRIERNKRLQVKP